MLEIKFSTCWFCMFRRSTFNLTIKLCKSTMTGNKWRLCVLKVQHPCQNFSCFTAAGTAGKMCRVWCAVSVSDLLEGGRAQVPGLRREAAPQLQTRSLQGVSEILVDLHSFLWCGQIHQLVPHRRLLFERPQWYVLMTCSFSHVWLESQIWLAVTLTELKILTSQMRTWETEQFTLLFLSKCFLKSFS